MDIETRVKELIVNQLFVDEFEIKNNSVLFKDLGADSLDGIELIMCIEDEFDIDIEEKNSFYQNITVQGVVDYIKKEVSNENK